MGLNDNSGFKPKIIKKKEKVLQLGRARTPKLSYMRLAVDIESIWTEGYAGQILNSGLELAIYVL